MELCTRRTKGDYERRVDLYVTKNANELPYIDDRTTCKVVLLKRGELTLSIDGSEQINCRAPAVITLNEREGVSVSTDSPYQTTTVFFKPSVINDVFEYERIYAGEFEGLNGTTLFQDYVIIRSFFFRGDNKRRCIRLSDESLVSMNALMSKLEAELAEQRDGFWPCRSRSYFIELLYMLISCADTEHDDENDLGFTTQVIEYLNNHIDEKIDLGTLTRHFHVNRNYLNNAFIAETGLTCLNYLLKTRMELARLWLAETELPIAEISRRLGYIDQNYFAKAFKKEAGVSPSEYRSSGTAK